MQKGNHRVVFIVLLALAAAPLIGCSGTTPSSPDSSPVFTGAGAREDRGGGPVGRSSQAHLASLGITGAPSGTQPQGLRVTGFTSSSKPSPLEAIGVKEGDVILSCNGRQEQMASRCLAAIEGLQERGEPITLVVIRDGERVELKRTEKLPEARDSEAPK